MRALALSAVICLSVITFSTCPVSAQAPQWWDGFAPAGFSASFSPLLASAIHGGELYTCGDFHSNGNTPMFRFAKWNAGQWEAIAEEPPFQTPAVIAFYDGELISNGVTPSWVPDGPWKWTGTAWEVVGEGLIGGYLNRVTGSVLFNGELVVIGDFTATGNSEQAAGIARWDGTSWSGLGGGLGGFAATVTLYQGDLYVGGGFSLNDDLSINDLARWDGTVWSAVSAINPQNSLVESGFGPGSQGWVYITSFALHDGKLAIGGDFSQVGTMPAANVAIYDATGIDAVWEVPAPTATPQRVDCLASFGSALYAGGQSGLVPGGSGAASLGIVGVSDWTAVDDGPDGDVLCLTTHDGLLQLGGDFDRAGGIAGRSWIGYDGTNFVARNNPHGAGLSGEVSGLDQYQGDLLATGRFSSAGELAVGGIATWDGNSWSALPGGGTPGAIDDTFIDGTDIYVAGRFEAIGGISAGSMARFDGSIWNTWPTPTDMALQSVFCIALFQGEVYVGFEARWNSDSSWVKGLMKWNGASWQILREDFQVLDMVVYDGKLLFCGRDDESPWVGLVSWDGSSFTAIQDAQDPDALEYRVRGLEVIGDVVYVMSTWTPSGSFAHVAMYDGTTLQGFGPYNTETLPSTSGIGIRDSEDLCFVDGIAYMTGRGEYNGFTVWSWDGTSSQWDIVDRGTDGTVFSAINFGEALYVGGQFSLTGMSRSLHRIGGDPSVSAGIALYYADQVVGTSPARRELLVLRQNRPNPFNPRTVIDFEIPAGGRQTTLRIYDLRGRVVRKLIDGFHPAGTDRITWDGLDDAGSEVASGNYLYVLEAGELTQARKMMLVR